MSEANIEVQPLNEPTLNESSEFAQCLQVNSSERPNVKRGRGRPRKSLQEKYDVDTSIEPEVKRVRGRPRKTLPAIDSNTNKCVQKTTPKFADCSPSNEQSMDAIDKENIVPKRLEMKPRDAPNGALTSYPLQEDPRAQMAYKKKSVAKEVQKPPARGRGRPRKNPPAETPPKKRSSKKTEEKETAAIEIEPGYYKGVEERENEETPLSKSHKKYSDGVRKLAKSFIKQT